VHEHEEHDQADDGPDEDEDPEEEAPRRTAAVHCHALGLAARQLLGAWTRGRHE
jgi:hypothetical protein